ncbi:putative Ig domain-containing protein [Pontibacter sp. MBLB2868]|uniref:putative Ig domain-containing protein n=1 Tax=Pontibacter sp. MBLB2868 TaxID=3451555 RepID=UPI003F753F98
MRNYIQKSSVLLGLLTWLALCYHGSVVQAQEVVKLEYYIDDDPGFGNGQSIPITPGLDISKSFPVDISTYLPGFHSLYVRALVKQHQVTEGDATATRGGWSITAVRTFYKESFDGSPTLPNIVKGEFFIDKDPGFGNGTTIPFTANTDLSNLTFSFDITNLPTGFHNLYVRFKDANKNWGTTSVRTFYKENFSNNTPSNTNIVKGEYFIDSDPGFGKGTNVAITPGSNLSNLAFTADISNVPAGFHQLYTRFKDANGRWGQTNVRSIFKEVLSTKDPLPNLVKAEYFVDSDPGYGKGRNIPITAATELINLTFALDMNEISIGNHKLYVRVQDAKKKWSLTSISDFVVESPQELYVLVGTITDQLCAGQTVEVPYTVNAPFGTNNIFTAQLSDAAGSFTNPVMIGTLTSNVAGTISATIPEAAAAGTGYRIRVVASSPTHTSTSNATDLTIRRLPVLSGISGDQYTCTSLKEYSVSPETGVTYTWKLSGGGTLTSIGNTASITWNSAGTHTITVTPANTCGEGEVRTLYVTVYDSAPAPTPVITASGRWMYASAAPLGSGVLDYQWYLNGAIIVSANSSSFYATENGSYTVSYRNSCGVSPVSNMISYSGNKLNQAITFEQIEDKTYGDEPFILNATASSGLAVSFHVQSGPATVSGNTLTITGAGTVEVVASQAGDENYNAAAPVSNTFVVSPLAATVALSNLNQTYNGQPRPVTVTTNPAGISTSVTYNASATVPVNAGSYAIVATISDPDYVGSSTETLVIGKASQTITLESVTDKTYGDAPFQVLASATSGLPVSLSVSTVPDGIATITGNTITILGAGTVTVTAKQAGDVNYVAAPDISTTFTVNKADQTINFTALQDKTYGDASFSLSATASSGLTVGFRIKSGPATISGTTLSISGAGVVEVEAYQDGDANYKAAPLVSRTFTVLKASQTIAFDPLPNKTYGDAPFDLSATATSGLTIDFSIVSGPATITGSTLTMTGTGTVVVRASQSGNENYLAAASVDRSFQVTSPDKIAQTITFTSITDKTYGDAAFELSASASSGLPVSFRIVSGQASIAGNMLTILGAGSITVEATQPGDATYQSASVSRSFTVQKATPGLSWNRPANIAEGTALSALQLNAVASVPGTFTYSPAAGTVLAAGNNRELSVYFVPQDADNYNSVPGTKTFITVNGAPVLTVTGLTSVNEHELLTLLSSATDVNDDVVSFSLVGVVPEGMTINAASGAVTWTPSEAQGPASYSIRIRATDNNTPVLYVEQTLTLTVEEVNAAPQLSGIPGAVTVDELSPYTFTATFSDVDLPANLLTLALEGAPQGATLNQQGVFNWTPTETQGPGSYTFKVRITDNGNPVLFAEQQITIQVNEVNQLPVLATIPAQFFASGDMVSFTAIASDADLPAQQLTYSLLSLAGENYPQGATINAATGVFSWNSAGHAYNEYKFKVKVADSNGGSTEQLVSLTLRSANQAPVLKAIGDKTVLAGSALAFILIATDDGLPAGKLTYSATNLPRGATLDATSGTFFWNTTGGQTGTYNITLTVSDGSLSASEAIKVNVIKKTAGLSPQIRKFSPTSGTVGTVVTIYGKYLTEVHNVRFNGVMADFDPIDENTIAAVVPQNATSGKITVNTVNGIVSSKQDFTVLTPAISGLNPSVGAVGTQVTIAGTDLENVTAVTFNGVPVEEVLSYSTTQLVVKVPGGATSGKVSVTASGKTLEGTVFTVADGLSATLEQTLHAAVEEASFNVYPNPFIDLATVSFTLKNGGHYTVLLYDSSGKLIKSLGDGTAEAEVATKIEVSSRGLNKGLYIIRLNTDEGSRSMKLVLNR